MINTAQVTPGKLQRDREANRRTLRRRFKRQHRIYPVRDVYRVAAAGIGRGFQMTGRVSGEWLLAPTCENPVPVQMDGAPAALRGGRHVRIDGKSFGLTLYTKCRRCADCLRRRRNLWAYRAQEEMKRAGRTWFATFTLAPFNHSVMWMRASARLAAGGTNLELLPDRDKRAEVAREYAAEITKYFKRLRKNTGADLRYILTSERHKSGLPHFHALIHEVKGSPPLKHDALTTNWKLGYTKFKLVEALQTAWYVAKYLAKAMDNRVRASLRYGADAELQVKTASKRIGDHREAVLNTAPPPLDGGIQQPWKGNTDDFVCKVYLRWFQPIRRSESSPSFDGSGTDADQALSPAPGVSAHDDDVGRLSRQEPLDDERRAYSRLYAALHPAPSVQDAAWRGWCLRLRFEEVRKSAHPSADGRGPGDQAPAHPAVAFKDRFWVPRPSVRDEPDSGDVAERGSALVSAVEVR